MEASDLTEVKRGSISRQIHELLPANRSNLGFDFQKQSSSLKCTNNKVSEEKPLTRNEMLDLTKDVLPDEDICGQLTAPHFVKKRNLENAKHNSLQRCDTPSGGSVESMSQGKMSSVQVKCETTERTSQVVSSGNRSGVSSCSTSGDEKKKGSLFLDQVREKLSDGEYKEFMGFMKALKSKAMKMGHVLQSIIKIFSAPDRLLLRQRFKEYVPAKYHPQYELYLQKTDDPAADR